MLLLPKRPVQEDETKSGANPLKTLGHEAKKKPWRDAPSNSVFTRALI
jgi:hypothetical protein